MFRAGYFFDHEEAFEVPGMVGTSKWVAGQLKWLTRNETGSICSVKPEECYTWLGDYLEQLRLSLLSINELWLDHNQTVQLVDKEELILARGLLEKERGDRADIVFGFEKKIENLTAENSTLTAENSKLSLRLKGLKRKRKDSRKVNRLLLVERRRKGGNTDVPSFIPVTFNLGADDNLVQGSLPNFDIFRDQSADDDESSSDDDDEALQYARVLKVSDLINVVTRVLDRSDTETVTSRKGDNITQETDENKQTEFSGKVFVVKLGD
ncbi:uncharacterized protein LOC118435081 isoform X2 [Folsomia candida]|nr:uncharacterized protein LOC118435081 isoform X2 [Folsomia candida]